MKCYVDIFRFSFNYGIAVHNLCYGHTGRVRFVYTRDILQYAVQLEDVLQGTVAAVGSQWYAAVRSITHSHIFAYLCALLIDIRVGPEFYGRSAKTCITRDIHQMPVNPPGLIFMPVAVQFLWEPEFEYTRTARALAVALAETASNREFV